jgi:hypothetical protein
MFDTEHISSESASDVMRWLQSEVAILWPALLGSLNCRRSRCVRVNCAACLSGEQHQSYVLYDRAEGHRMRWLCHNSFLRGWVGGGVRAGKGGRPITNV